MCPPDLPDAPVEVIRDELHRVLSELPNPRVVASEAEPLATEQLYVWLRDAIANPAMLRPLIALVPFHAWQGRVTVFYGREKLAGKSTELADAVAHASHGEPVYGEPVAAPVSVLWVGIDEPAADTVQRFVANEANVDRIALRHQLGTLDDVRAAVEQSGAKMVVVDSLTRWAHGKVQGSGDSEGWRSVMVEFVTLAREMDVAVVLVHHAQKGEGREYRDSTEIGSNADVLVGMAPRSADRQDTRRRLDAVGRGVGFQLDVTYDVETRRYVAAQHDEGAEPVARGEGALLPVLRLLADAEPHGLTWADWKSRAVRLGHSKSTFDRVRRLAVGRALALGPDNTRTGSYRVTSAGERALGGGT
jgi:hypothetical protein